MSGFSFEDSEKFALAVMKSCWTTVEGEVTLSDGTVVLNHLPTTLDDKWKKWLGDIRAYQLGQGNLIVVRRLQSSQPGIYDQEDQMLEQELSEFLVLLRFFGPIGYEGAELIAGAKHDDEIHIRRVVEMDVLYSTRDSQLEPVTTKKLEEAAKARIARQGLISAADEYRRLKRGFRALGQGLMEYHSEDRLHQFVRSIEALMIPEIGKTKKQFIERSCALTSGNTGTDTILGEVYDMRCDVEHVHEWDRSLQGYLPAQREDTALRRTRQVEALACFAYRQILSDPLLQEHFKSDIEIQTFWKQPSSVIVSALSPGVDIASIP